MMRPPVYTHKFGEPAAEAIIRWMSSGGSSGDTASLVIWGHSFLGLGHAVADYQGRKCQTLDQGGSRTSMDSSCRRHGMSVEIEHTEDPLFVP